MDLSVPGYYQDDIFRLCHTDTVGWVSCKAEDFFSLPDFCVFSASLNARLFGGKVSPGQRTRAFLMSFSSRREVGGKHVVGDRRGK